MKRKFRHEGRKTTACTVKTNRLPALSIGQTPLFVSMIYTNIPAMFNKEG